MPCRRVGHPDNRKVLQVAEFLAIIFAVAHCLLYCAASQLESVAKYRTLADSYFKSYLHSETRTYLGGTGHHLHWAYGAPDTFLTPNAFTFSLLWISVIFARPKRFAAGIFIFILAVFYAQLIYFGLSFEAGSVWC
jgi:hypothetical protein